MKELKPIEETWNKKRIAIGLVFLFIAVAGLTAFKVLVLDKNQENIVQPPKNNTSVKAASTANTSNKENAVSDLKSNIQEQINTLQKEAANLNVAEIASSSPQVQKVLEDIKAVQNLPKNQAKSFCEQVCSGL